MKIKPILLLLALSSCLFSCGQNIKHPGNPRLIANSSITHWQSNLGIEKSREIGMLINYESYLAPVPDELSKGVVESATLLTGKGERLKLIARSVDLTQLQDGKGNGKLQPVEIVFDGSSATFDGWNVLSFDFWMPVLWNDFDGQKTGSVAFRLDSAPAVKGIVFDLKRNSLSVEFSEVVGGETLNAVQVLGPAGPLKCIFAGWGVPQDQLLLTCVDSLPETITIVVNQQLQANGKPVTDVDGLPFKLTVSPAKLPLRADNLSLWRP